MDSFEKNYQMAMSLWLFSSNRNGHTIPTNGVDMATTASQIKMEEEQRRQCQEILDKIPEHRFLMNLKQEPIMVDGNGELPLRHFGAMGRNPGGHAPRGRPPASMQSNGVISPDRKHVCPHCYKAFKSRQQLMQHNLVHSNLRKYRCSFCERAFKQLSHLHQHHRIHTGEKPYRCPLPGCDRAFPQLSNLQHHIRNHDKLVDSTFQCIQCDRAYPNEATLKAHNTRVSVKIAWWHCAIQFPL
ncbi:hypothetical protein FSP39_003406 [Pinctada imbricata]|uniref:C2H2-type domain-containing protein n=1 Tax=Pinctada imbricata TaxID=66713 RepID=A0AA89C7T6_PINIB|nr:hypothetical protein FSP39_003406 [Pinctada imbricata]